MDVRDVREAFLKSDTGATLKLKEREPHKRRIDGAGAAGVDEPLLPPDPPASQPHSSRPATPRCRGAWALP